MNAQRDWGHAKDYVEAMYLILQQEKPEDYVIATGITTSIRDFVNMAFTFLGVEIRFEGNGAEEKGYVSSLDENRLKQLHLEDAIQLKVGNCVVAIDPRYYRPTEVDLLIGDATKSRTKLGWEPKYNLSQLVDDMMDSDLRLMKKEKFLKDAGHEVLSQHE
jgi:GDPmannose 4,6-dehydratase